MLSALWANNAFAAIKHGLFLTIYMTMAAGFVLRLSPRQITVAVLVSQGLLAAASMMTMTRVWADGAYALVGVFPHKNVLSQRMVFLSAAALTVLLSPGYRWLWKPVALIFLLVAAFMVREALSATGVILLAGVVAMAVGIGLLWRPAGQVRGLRPALLFGGVGAAAVGMLVLLNVYDIDPLSDGLDALGKDSTLTGRTVVWQLGNEKLKENPLLGVGAGHFWTEGNPAAVRIADRFWSSGGRFSFHNSYYETLVHVGIVGLIAAVITYWQTFSAIIGRWWRDPSQADLFFLLMAALMFLRSFTESDLFSVKVLGPQLLWFGAFSALYERAAPRG